MPTFLERYLAGEREQVWAELIALGEKVREEPVYSDAWAVAQETMRRAKANIETIYERLKSIGYLFERFQSAYAPPEPDITAQIEVFEHEVGPLPLSLRAWLEIVGDVDFIGSYPGLTYYGEPEPPFRTIEEAVTEAAEIYADPLCVGVWNFDSAVECYNEWREDFGESNPYKAENYPEWKEAYETGEIEDDDFFAVEISPDLYFKMRVGGGAPYMITLPDPRADSYVLNEPHDTMFVDYLRICFRWGGFPGLAHYAKYNEAVLETLKEGLLEI